jgi:Fe-S-cluster containining protein
MQEHQFTRTVCACEKCRACCKRQPGPLAHGDFERIADHVAKTQELSGEIAFEQVKRQLCASPGALVMDSATGAIKRIGSITPKRAKGRCVFLDEQERCSIHEVAPFGCAFFDTHMDARVAHPRSVWLAHNQCEPDYQKLRDELPYAQSYKPTAY